MKRLPFFLLLFLVKFSSAFLPKTKHTTIERNDSLLVVQTAAARESASDFFYKLQYVSTPTLCSFYSEYSKVWPTDKQWQKKPFLFHANIQIPIAIGGRWFQTVNHGKGVRFAVLLHPDFEIRLLQNDKSVGDTSTPVRTPSYLPGVTFFFTHATMWDKHPSQHYVGFKVYHHSNGQDGVHFRAQDNGYYNRYNGDFSDNVCFEFIYGGFFGSKESKVLHPNKLFSNNHNRVLSISHNFFWRTSFELRPGTMIDPFLNTNNLYGRYRSHAQFGWIYAPVYQELVRSGKETLLNGEPQKMERFRLWIDLDYIQDLNYNSGAVILPLDANAGNTLKAVPLYDVAKRLNVAVTGSFRLWGVPFAGIFAQLGYQGSDPYNAYFQQSRFFVRAGISAGWLLYKPRSQRLNKFRNLAEK